jgi:hypothetical protein
MPALAPVLSPDDAPLIGEGVADEEAEEDATGTDTKTVTVLPAVAEDVLAAEVVVALDVEDWSRIANKEDSKGLPKFVPLQM